MNPREYLKELANVAANLDKVRIGAVIERVLLARDEEATVWLIGNGGSMATAMHFAADLSKTPAKPVRAVSLDNPALLTAISNDWSYKRTFTHPLKWAAVNDVLIVISGSGNSQNVVDAALSFRGTVIALLGFDGGELGWRLADEDATVVIVPSDNYGIIEDLHCSILHMVVEALKDNG